MKKQLKQKKKLTEKEICKRTNQIVKLMNEFSRKEFDPLFYQSPYYAQLKEIFNMGVWYGAYKAIQSYETKRK